jgi:hypothetical protein
MVTTMVHGPGHRLRSYELVARAAGLVPVGSAPPIGADESVPA